MLQDVLPKNGDAGKRPEAVAYLVQCYPSSQRRACRVLRHSRSTHRYRSRARDQSALRLRLRDLARARPRYGYLRLQVLLRRAGWRVNVKRVWRQYKQLGLNLRSKGGRKKRTSQPPLLCEHLQGCKLLALL